jgi:4-amino-4-deoxy-L-arabinose transferase-like glycosyltransferase
MAMPPSKAWPVFAAATVMVILAAGLSWSLAHPYGIYWDEAEYFSQAATDLQRLHSLELLRLGGRMLVTSSGRPPAYRLLVLPFLAPFSFQTTIARLASLVWFGFSSWFIYLATRRIGSQVAGAIAVLIFCLSPEVVAASICFGTEGPLYLATSAMMYYLFECWGGVGDRPANWVGLGLALGLGFLSKASFIAIAIPILVFWLVISYWGRLGVPSIFSQLKSSAVALLVAGPWWLLHIKDAIAFARYARTYDRHSVGPPSILTWTRWLNSVVQCLLGHAVSILIAAIIIAAVIRIIQKKGIFLDPLQKAAMGACLCAAIPIVVVQLSGTNHLLRHISPAMIPLAIGAGILADKIEWTGSRVPLTFFAILFCAQLLMIVTPAAFPNKHFVDKGFVTGTVPWRVMARVDQWNWKPMRTIADNCGLETPTISYLGNGPTFNAPQIEYPWAPFTSNFLARANVVWLWRYEDGTLDWQKVMDAASTYDFVLTAPQYAGDIKDRQDLDNRFNAEFADRLSHDSRFAGPIRLEMGRFGPVEVTVFMKKSLSCHLDNNSTAMK